MVGADVDLVAGSGFLGGGGGALRGRTVASLVLVIADIISVSSATISSFLLGLLDDVVELLELLAAPILNFSIPALKVPDFNSRMSN